MFISSPPRSIHGGSSGYNPSSGTSASSSLSGSSDENLPSPSGSRRSHHSSDNDDGANGGYSNPGNSPRSSGDQENESDEPEVRSPEPSNNAGSPGGNPSNDDPNLSSDNNSPESPSNDNPQPVGGSNPRHVSPETPILTSSSGDNPRSRSDDVGPAAAMVANNAPSNVHNIQLNSGLQSFSVGQGAPAIAPPIFDSNDNGNPAGNNDFRIGPPVTLYRSTIVDGFSTRPNSLGNRSFRPANLTLPGPDPGLNVEITSDNQADDHPVYDIKLSFNINEDSKGEEDSAQGAQHPNILFDTSYSCSGSSSRKRRRSTDTDDEDYAHDTEQRNLSASSNLIVQASTITHKSAVTPQGSQNSFASSSNQGSSSQKRGRSDNDDYGGTHDTKKRCLSTPREPQNSPTSASKSPVPDIASPTDYMVSGSASMAMADSDGSGSSNTGPLLLPHFDQWVILPNPPHGIG